MKIKLLTRNILLLAALLLFSTAKSLAQYNGTFGMGAHLNYATEIARPGIGLDIHYYLTNNFRIAPSLTYYMSVKNKSMWNIDGDVHYVVPIGTQFSFYPLLGLHFSEWKNMKELSEPSDKNIYNKRLGLNAGLGFQYDLSYKTRATFEVKYQSIKDYSQVAFMLGVGFWL